MASGLAARLDDVAALDGSGWRVLPLATLGAVGPTTPTPKGCSSDCPSNGGPPAEQ